MEFITLNNGVKMPAEGIGTFLLTPDEAETAVLSALKDGARHELSRASFSKRWHQRWLAYRSR